MSDIRTLSQEAVVDSIRDIATASLEVCMQDHTFLQHKMILGANAMFLRSTIACYIADISHKEDWDTEILKNTLEAMVNDLNKLIHTYTNVKL